jgi:diguanylate cyclase (GGDEF)-like protein
MPAMTDREVAVRWHALGVLCAAGAMFGTLSILVPMPASADLPALWVNITLAYATAAAMYVLGRRRAPVWATHVFLVGGTYLVTNAVLQSGQGGSYYAVWYTWIALYAFSFYGRAAASAHVALAAAAYAGTLAVLPVEAPVSRWLTTMSAVLVAAAFVDHLVRRARAHAAAAEQLARQLEAAAQTDELTGLPNRRTWEQALKREVANARRFGRPLAVAVLDLDGFKRFNDEHGHQAGDVLLREAAAAWSDDVRDIDTLARWGGDEFGLLVPGCTTADALSVIERMRTSTPGTTCSVGLVAWDGVEDEGALMARADVELYRAKRSGRDRVAVGTLT